MHFAEISGRSDAICFRNIANSDKLNLKKKQKE